MCNISIESQRANKEIGSSLEASLTISLNERMFKKYKDINFSELCITSSAKIEKSDVEEIVVKSKKAEGTKCPLCWKISPEQCERPHCPQN